MGKVGLHSLTQGIATGNDEQTTFYMVYQNRLLVYLLNYIEMIMDKAHHCLLILTTRPMCNIHMCSTMNCDKHVESSCMYVDWHEQIKKRKYEKNPSGLNSNWWVVCVCAKLSVLCEQMSFQIFLYLLAN